MPRPLTARERAALDLLLSVNFPGARELRAQAASVEGSGDALVIHLSVDPALALAPVTSRQPVEAVVDGAGYDGGLLLFVDDGRLSALEYWWVTEEPPEKFPPVEAIGRPIA